MKTIGIDDVDPFHNMFMNHIYYIKSTYNNKIELIHHYILIIINSKRVLKEKYNAFLNNYLLYDEEFNIANHYIYYVISQLINFYGYNIEYNVSSGSVILNKINYIKFYNFSYRDINFIYKSC